jgi:ATP-binding cassette, subfamily B, bacterial CvaB/MchF/RaxB
MKIVLQSESSECGIACLAMIASASGKNIDLRELRRKCNISSKGTTLRALIQHAAQLGFASRPLRLELSEVYQLKLPAILHWDLNHFVVIVKVTRRGVVIHDPAVGKRSLSLEECSRHFTGVALELTPNTDFEQHKAAPKVALSSLSGKTHGLKRSLLQLFALALVLQLFAVAAPLVNQTIVDDVLTSGDHELLTIVVIGFALLMCIQTALGMARSWMVMLLGQSLALQWTGNVFAHLIRLPVRYFEQRHLGDITSRFGAVGAIQQTLTTAVIEAVLDGIMGVASLVMMLMYSPKLACVVLAAVTCYGLLRWLFYQPLRDAYAERLVVSAKENTHFLETLRGILPLKLFGREEERRVRWQNLVVDVQNRDVRTAKMGIAFSTANTFIFGVESLVVLWLGAQLILSAQQSGGALVAGSGAGVFTVGMLMAFLSYKGQFTGRVSALIDYAVQIKMLELHSERLADIVLEPPEHDDLPAHDLKHLAPSLELRGVSFRYGDSEPWVLKDASFKVEAGQSVAVVGPSGAGKTTLLKIMLGILHPQEGEVLYGGIPVKHLGISNVRQRIGTVMQDDVLLTGSIADNISFFDVNVDQARVEACAAMSNVHADISCMPMGYHTLVGDLGSGLSGGQKQRLLLARALYKNPSVLALDEATSHLDVMNEREVTARLSQLLLTRLIIAHRPETIAGAKRVVQLMNGQVVEMMRAAPNHPPDQGKEAA